MRDSIETIAGNEKLLPSEAPPPHESPGPKACCSSYCQPNYCHPSETAYMASGFSTPALDSVAALPGCAATAHLPADRCLQ